MRKFQLIQESKSYFLQKKQQYGILASYVAPDGVSFSVVEEVIKPHGNGICHVDIPVGDMQRAKKFYGETFGWKFNEWKPEYVLFETDDSKYPVEGGLNLVTDEKTRLSFASIHFHVEDVDAALAKIKANGGTIVKGKDSIPHVGSFGSFKDSEGNLLSLYSAAT